MRRLALAVMITAATLVALPAAATTPQSVRFEVPTFFNQTNYFTATGGAVDAGLVCESGSVDDVGGMASGGSPAGINFQVLKLFTCDDDSGSFLVKLQVRLNFRGDNFQWVVLSGDGAYANLHASGTGIGTNPDDIPDFVLDQYSGQVHID